MVCVCTNCQQRERERNAHSCLPFFHCLLQPLQLTANQANPWSPHCTLHMNPQLILCVYGWLEMNKETMLHSMANSCEPTADSASPLIKDAHTQDHVSEARHSETVTNQMLPSLHIKSNKRGRTLPSSRKNTCHFKCLSVWARNNSSHPQIMKYLVSTFHVQKLLCP